MSRVIPPFLPSHLSVFSFPPTPLLFIHLLPSAAHSRFCRDLSSLPLFLLAPDACEGPRVSLVGGWGGDPGGGWQQGRAGAHPSPGWQSCFPKDRHSKGEPDQVIAAQEKAFFTTDTEEGDRGWAVLMPR